MKNDAIKDKKDNNDNISIDHDAENAILLSLITPKTAKELEKITGRNVRTVQRILQKLQKNGKIKEVSKAERRRLDWAPDPAIYPPEKWKDHETDMRIPVYIAVNNDPLEIRKGIDDNIEKLNNENFDVLADLIIGRYKKYDPLFSGEEKLEKLLKIYVKHPDPTLLNKILNICEALREKKPFGAMKPDLPEKLNGILNGGASSKLVLIFIKKALFEVNDNEIDEVLDSIETMKEAEINAVIGMLYNLVERGGFAQYLETHRAKIIDLALKLKRKGISGGVVDELLNL